ncbi:hypothetical protein PZBJ_06085 [Pantoea endophytica]|uniref:DUF5405 domain-containing protein n=1 Tax=Pantoea endophytica TaxID=92488 RepID=A0ABX4SVA7_9GAMM|nr:DUF5405 family protein [Pantoea endophytica]PLR26351.1 hypothetical protein PZBJ_06085 [Pantoea endophytica]
MQIGIGEKYVLTADQYQNIIREKKITKEDDNAGKEWQQLVGYYTKLSQAIHALIQLDVRLEDVQSLQAMEQHINRVALQCEKAFIQTAE